MGSIMGSLVPGMESIKDFDDDDDDTFFSQGRNLEPITPHVSFLRS